jgi:hypothetical protein
MDALKHLHAETAARLDAMQLSLPDRAFPTRSAQWRNMKRISHLKFRREPIAATVT